MYLILFFILSAALAIPTWGFSLIVFFFVKNWFDSQAMSAILSMVNSSMRQEVTQELYHINKGAVHKLFDRFCVGATRQIRNHDGGISIYWGVFNHPMIEGGMPFSLRIVYTPRNGTKNTIYIKAAQGVDEDVLSENIFAASLGTSMRPAQPNLSNHTAAIENDEEFNSAIEMVGRFMIPQIEELELNGENIPITNVSFIYVSTLASCLTKKGFTLQQVKQMIEHFHPGNSRAAGVENALLLIDSNPSDFREKCKEIIPIVNAEVASGKGEFFKKYTRKANKEIERMFEDTDFDPRTAKPTNWLEV
jgi:hypothetical protein